MNTRHMLAAATAFSLLWVTLAKPSTAGGFYSPYQSTSAIATAFAGASARSDDAGFFLYNPATISGLDGTQSYFDLRAFAPTAHMTPSRAVSPAGIDVTAAGASGDIAGEAIAPGSVTAVKLAPGLTLGWGGSAPFATDVKTSSEWGGRFHLLGTRIVAMSMTAAASYEVTPWLAISAGVTGDWLDTRFENVALLPIPGGAPVESYSYMKGKDWGVGAVFGAVIAPAPGTRIGVSYHSQVEHTLDGYAAAAFPGFPAEITRYDLDLPQYASLGVEHRAGARLRVFGEIGWVDWSAFKGFDIGFASGRPNEVRPVVWHDTWMFAGGFAYELAPGTEISAGAHYDMAASESGSGLTLSTDAEKIMAAVGVSHEIAGIGTASLSYAHVFALDAPIRASNASSGLLEGTLDAEVDMIGIGLARKW